MGFISGWQGFRGPRFDSRVSPQTTWGRVNFTANPDPTQILTVHSVALWDSASNVVVRPTLP